MMDEYSVATVAEYAKLCGGSRPITKVLVANNGIAAVKAIRSVRKWAYEMFGNERAIEFVAMATPEDLKANAEYIRMADAFCEVPGGTNNNNYANVEIIVDMAERTGAHAVWAGWGHASENPRLPEALSLTRDNIVFIGPPAIAMRDLGDKIASTIVAQSAAVKCVPWSGDGLTVKYSEGGIPSDIYSQATVETVEQAIATVERIGFPVMVKASEGGGGKGIRKVTAMEDLAAAFRQVTGEVPGSPVFLMKLVPNARHLEVQIIGDAHGAAIALYGRDCSVQRRHQKIMEEGPTVAAADDVWEEMERAAVRLVKEVGYVGAGTVEYLFQDGKYYFLELNPRLQVEHPVTEEITGVNLPATQLQIAMGIPLHRIPEIRKLYNRVPFGSDAINFDTDKRLPPKGHVIAVRITGENPDEGFKPTSGDIHELTFRSTPNVWGYFSVGPRGGLHEYADSQFGHIFARGGSREEARKAMVLGLKEISIRGDIRTPVEYVIHLLETEDYRKNRIHTGWLDGLIANRIATSKPEIMVAVLCGVLYKAHQICAASLEEYTKQLSWGQVPSPTLLRTNLSVELIYLNVKYCFIASRAGPTHYSLSLSKEKTPESDGVVVEAQVRTMSDGGLLVLLDGKMHVTYGKEDVTGLRLTVDSKTCVFSRDYDPTALRSTTPGKLVRYLVPDLAHVDKGTPYAEIEVMKMYMPLLAPEAGRITQLMQEGSSMVSGDMIASLELDDPSRITRPVVFSGSLPPLKPATVVGDKPHQKLRNSILNIHRILLGYDNQRVRETVDEFFEQAIHPRLPALDFNDSLSVLGGRIPKPIYDGIKGEVAKYEAILATNPVTASFAPYAAEISSLLSRSIEAIPQADRKGVSNACSPLRELADQYCDGVQGRLVTLVTSFLEEFLGVEKLFQGKSMQAAVRDLKEQFKDEPSKVVAATLSHHTQSKKKTLVLAILEKVEAQGSVDQYISILNEMSIISGRNIEVSLKAKHMLIRYQLPSYKQRAVAVEASLMAILAVDESSEGPSSSSSSRGFSFLDGDLDGTSSNQDRSRLIHAMVDQSADLFDVLLGLFSSKNLRLRALAVEIFVRRAYRTYNIDSLHAEAQPPKHLHVEWLFSTQSRNTSTGSLGGMVRTDSQDGLALLEERERSRLRFGMLLFFETNEDLEENFADAMNHYRKARLGHASSLNGSGSGIHSLSSSGSGNLSNGMPSSPQPSSSSSSNGAPASPLTLSGSHVVPSASPTLASEAGINILQVVLKQWPQSIAAEQELIKTLGGFLRDRRPLLNSAGIRRVTFVCAKDGHQPRYYTFRERHQFEEDPIFRNIEPALAGDLEIRRLANFDIQQLPTEYHHLHVYYAEDKDRKREADCHRCFFIRAVVRQGDMFTYTEHRLVEFLLSEIDRLLSEALDALEVALGRSQYSRAQNHHIFLNVLPEIEFDEKKLAPVVQKIGGRHGRKMWKLGVQQCEIRVKYRRAVPHPALPLRFFVSNPSGFSFRTAHYYEMAVPGSAIILKSLPGEPPGALDGKPADVPYEVMDIMQRRRFQAQHLNTTYVYDFLDLFKEALQQSWTKHADLTGDKLPAKGDLFNAVELILSKETDDVRWGDVTLKTTDRPIGKNTIGMVAWRIHMKTPECPQGREIIVIANDITFQIGSFGPLEDILFKKASELARLEGLPRIYLSANSGARIGLADEVKDKFQVMWVSPSDPSKGFKYLYLEDAEYTTLAKNGSVKAERNEAGHWVITDIIGACHGIGVENLSASGLIAGETSLAYTEIFTITLVTGRSVGIGAYLVRLGQRTVQNEGPIILTGATALNKVLGKDVYESNHQIGGSQIMYTNGVTHLAVNDELGGVASILNWLAYVPSRRGSPGPVLKTMDPIDRDVTFVPSQNGKYDVRHMLVGAPAPDGRVGGGAFLGGLFDKDSFMETLGGWAKTVVTGRARLGGIPVGVIAVEARTVEKVVPADPANMESHEVVTAQAAHVWFPDSSFKTAQAILDFNNGEELPLFILADWRGFSGGMRDMFDEILKFGSMIVDNLRTYKQPVFIYIPPEGELRGGAWVVLDSMINPQMMEMYADTNSRGGVLEPAGIVEIKYRDRDLLKTMHRIDAKLIAWSQDLAKTTSGSQDAKQIKDAITQREKELLPLYQQVSIKFADLHDTPGRMHAKGSIRQVVPWATSRRYFYHRLQRRLAEERVRKLIKDTRPDLSYTDSTTILQKWFVEKGHTVESWDDDHLVLAWLRDDDASFSSRSRDLQQLIHHEGSETPDIADAYLAAISKLPLETQRKLAEKLRAQLG